MCLSSLMVCHNECPMLLKFQQTHDARLGNKNEYLYSLLYLLLTSGIYTKSVMNKKYKNVINHELIILHNIT